jgi:hypothetical protein
MVLLDNVIQVFTLPNLNAVEATFIANPNSMSITATLVNVNHLRSSIAMNSFNQKGLG